VIAGNTESETTRTWKGHSKGLEDGNRDCAGRTRGGGGVVRGGSTLVDRKTGLRRPKFQLFIKRRMKGQNKGSPLGKLRATRWWRILQTYPQQGAGEVQGVHRDKVKKGIPQSSGDRCRRSPGKFHEAAPWWPSLRRGRPRVGKDMERNLLPKTLKKLGTRALPRRLKYAGRSKCERAQAKPRGGGGSCQDATCH